MVNERLSARRCTTEELLSLVEQASRMRGPGVGVPSVVSSCPLPLKGHWTYVVCWAERGMRRFHEISYDVEHEMGAALEPLPSEQEHEMLCALQCLASRSAPIGT